MTEVVCGSSRRRSQHNSVLGDSNVILSQRDNMFNLLIVVVGSVCLGYISAAPSTGSCECVHGSGVKVHSSGIVSQSCLQSICEVESGCKPIGCRFDVNSDSCGYFQIKHDYWLDCGSPGTSWHACADDLSCASLCVQNYMNRYAAHYGCPLTCEGFAREHNGGPRGCHKSSTLRYWHHVQAKGCH